MEVDRYWCAGSHTWASALFLAIRYVALLGHVPFLYRMFGEPCEAMVGYNLLASRLSLIFLLQAFVSLCFLTPTQPANFLQGAPYGIVP